MFAKLKIQCRCGSDLFVEEKDKPKTQGLSGKYKFVVYECPVCGGEVKVQY